MTEKDAIYEIQTELSQLDETNNLKSYVYQILFADILDRHLKTLSSGYESISKYNLAWVLVSTSFDIVKPISGCIKLYAQTWFSERRGPFFRREASFQDESGVVRFCGSTFSVLMDMEKRAAFRQKELPFEISDPIPEFMAEASPFFRTGVQYEDVEVRKVRNCFIDVLGHMNNTRYGELAYDTLNEPELFCMQDLKRVDVHFISEIKRGETLTVQKAYDGNKILVRGLHADGKSVVFDYTLEFSKL